MSSEEEQSVEQEMVLQQEDDNYEHITMKKHNQKQLESLLYLRVLLVENDDSSRIIISALLRKCGYTVVAVSDGSKAWEILRGRASNIDLVLTELDLPSLAGFSLLRFMMKDDICRQIPVIMMSSHDSINVVFDSMLGGAADFLLKPLRKNELRNLWQHVWRRHSFKNSGHNSPNVNHVQKKVEASEENGSTECSSDCVAFPKVHKECSEKGSDAQQSSCTKPETEVQSANMPTVSHPAYRTTSVDNGTMTSTYGECVEMESLFLMHDNEAKDESVMLGPEVVHNKRKKLNGVGSEGEFSAASSKQLEPSREAMDLIGAFDTHYNTHSQEISFTDGDADLYKHSSTSLLELSLKRPYYGDPEIPQISERNTLNHSNASAFSHYDDRALQPHFVTSTEVCAEAHECASASCKHLSNQAFGDTINKCPQSCSAMKDCPETMTAPVGGDQHVKAKSVFSCAQHGVISATSVMPPLFFAQSVPLPLQSSLTASQHKSVVPEHFNHEYKETDYLHSQNANNASNQAMNGLKEKKLETLEDPRYVSPLSAQSASSSLCNSVVSQLNSSECGSDCSGSNENTVTILGSSNGSASEKIFLTGDRTRGLDSHCFTQREAALTKFRLKRKDRCFEKKVRYQSRKRLAEQRPRVKGQFVRQMPS